MKKNEQNPEHFEGNEGDIANKFSQSSYAADCHRFHGKSKGKGTVKQTITFYMKFHLKQSICVFSFICEMRK